LRHTLPLKPVIDELQEALRCAVDSIDGSSQQEFRSSIDNVCVAVSKSLTKPALFFEKTPEWLKSVRALVAKKSPSVQEKFLLPVHNANRQACKLLLDAGVLYLAACQDDFSVRFTSAGYQRLMAGFESTTRTSMNVGALAKQFVTDLESIVSRKANTERGRKAVLVCMRSAIRCARIRYIIFFPA
jgi:hypothetical protein